MRIINSIKKNKREAFLTIALGIFLLCHTYQEFRNEKFSITNASKHEGTIEIFATLFGALIVIFFFYRMHNAIEKS